MFFPEFVNTLKRKFFFTAAEKRGGGIRGGEKDKELAWGRLRVFPRAAAG